MSDGTRQLEDGHHRMWEQLDAELEPLVSGGALRQAIERLTAALEAMGDSGETAGLRAKVLARRGECLLDLDRSEEALQDARRSMELGGRSSENCGLAGWASYHLGELGRAQEYFDEALARDAQEVSHLTGRALVAMESGDLQRARTELNRALRQDADAVEALGLRGEVQLEMGELEAAARDLERALEQAPQEAEYALMLSRLYMVRGETEQALKVIDGAVDEDEDFALEALLLRSHIHLVSGDTKTARSDAIRASNLFPDEAFAFVQLAHVQLGEGSLALAKKAAERAVLLDPSLPDSYIVRAAAHQMAGDEERAKEDFQRASQAPAELPMFLLGPAYEAMQAPPLGLDPSILEALGGQGQAGGFDPSVFAQVFGGTDGEQGHGPAPGAMPPGMNPMNMLGKIFDDAGNIRRPFKPIFEMAFKNAPKIMENLPPGLLGDIDKEELEKIDFSELSSEELEERMREFYQMMQSGGGPFSPDNGDGGDGEE